MGRKRLQNIRFILYSINIMMGTLGITFISFGIKWVIFDYRHQKAAACKHISVGGFLIAFGILLFICIIIGLLGILRDVGRLQQANSTLMLILIFVFMDFGIVTLSIGNPNSAYMKRLHEEVVIRFRDPKEDTAQFFVFAQTEFKCCGIDGYKDYDKYPKYKKMTKIEFYPDSCCESKSPCKEPDYKNGCGEKIIQYRWQRFEVAAVLSFAFVVIGVCEVVFLCLLKREKQRQMQVLEEIQLTRRNTREMEAAKSVKSGPKETEEDLVKRRERERKDRTVRRVKEILTMSSSSDTCAAGLEETKRKLNVDSECVGDVEMEQPEPSRVQIQAELSSS